MQEGRPSGDSYHVFLDVYPLLKRKLILNAVAGLNWTEDMMERHNLMMELGAEYPVLRPDEAMEVERQLQERVLQVDEEPRADPPYNATWFLPKIAFHSEVTFVPESEFTSNSELAPEKKDIGSEFKAWKQSKALGLTFGFGSWCGYDLRELEGLRRERPEVVQAEFDRVKNWCKDQINPYVRWDDDIPEGQRGEWPDAMAGSGIKMVLKPLRRARPLISKWKAGAWKYYYGKIEYNRDAVDENGIVQQVVNMVKATEQPVKKYRRQPILPKCIPRVKHKMPARWQGVDQYYASWSADSYGLQSNNCNTFSDALLWHLGLGRMIWWHIGLSYLAGTSAKVDQAPASN